MQAIQRRVEADTSRADRLVLDQWVPQLSSKKLGLTDDKTGQSYPTYQSIIDDLRASEEAYGDVLFIDSVSYSTFAQSDRYFVTLAPSGFDSPEQAIGWCDTRGIPANGCFAKYLSRTITAGPDMQIYRR